MKLTTAQKQKRYRENLKRKGRHNAMKAKNLERMKNIRSKLSNFQREHYRQRDTTSKSTVFSDFYSLTSKNMYRFVSTRTCISNSENIKRPVLDA
jgi:hypothetical protein